MNTVRKVVALITDSFFTIAAIFLGCSAALEFINAVGRKFFSFSFSWSEELSTYFVVIAVFFTISYLELHGRQLSVDILSIIVKNKTVLKIIYILYGLLTLVLLILIVKYGISATMSAYSAHTETYALRWPKYIFFAVAVTGVFMGIVSWLTIIIFNKGEKL